MNKKTRKKISFRVFWKKMIKELIKEKNIVTLKLDLIEKKNNLLTEVIDTEYQEILYREK